MPHRKDKTPEKLYVPGTRDAEGDVGAYDRYIDEYDGYAPEDLEALEEEIGAEEGELDVEELVEIQKTREGIDENDDTDRLFDDCEYINVPRIPQQWRGSDIIGKRTQASSASTGIEIGKIAPKDLLRDTWNSLTDVEKYILMLVSEHRHLTLSQFEALIVIPSQLRMKPGGINNTKSYYEWVTKQKHGVEGMNYKNTFKMKKPDGLARKITNMCKQGLLEEIIPAYGVNEKNISERYLATPSLFTKHYYLTPLGAKVLICNTKANKPASRVNPVGFVPTYKSAAYITNLHEAESTEILCSLISCAAYATNPDGDKDYGLFDVCRFYHEKDVEEKHVEYQGKKIDFKTDGKLTMYVESIGDFVDWYIEYDSGSSTKDKITHKTEAFIKYIFWKRQQYGERFRKPVLLLVTQKPADFFPQLKGKEKTTYTTGIKNMAHKYFEEYMDILNDIAIVLVADCGSIRAHGALGACWHKVDLTTGVPSMKAYDLITASRGLYEEDDLLSSGAATTSNADETGDEEE